jgi:plastocyanin
MKPRRILPAILLIAAVSSSALWADTGLRPVDIAFETAGSDLTGSVTILSSGIPVRWRNDTLAAHRIRHDGCIADRACAFQSVTVPPHDSFMIAPLAAGRYPYHCALHPLMRGLLIVLSPEAAGAFPVVQHRGNDVPAAFLSAERRSR